MGRWQDPSGSRRSQDDEQEERYFGMSPTGFNLAFFAVVGAIALAAFLYFGGTGAVEDFLGNDDPSAGKTAQRQESPADGSKANTADESQTSSDKPKSDSSDGGSSADTGGESVTALLDTFSPMNFLGTLGGGETFTGTSGGLEPASTADADELKAALLSQQDLPAGFASFGEMSFTMPVESGSADMHATMFASGDPASDDFGAMVMSAVVAGSPEAFGETDGFGDLGSLSQEELDEIVSEMQQLEEVGLGVQDFQILDASGLGDGGMGMYMVMDFGGLLESFGDLGEEAPFDSMAWDMYMWTRGDRMLMLMVMWTSAQPSGVDSLSLAETMDDRAAAAW